MHMKTMKRSSKINPKDPSQIRSSSLRRFHGVRSSETRFGTTISRETKDISRGKRVKFTDPETDHPLSCRPDASSIPLEGTQAPRSDDPKTSEYAFFKKLKKDADRSFHSYPLHEDSQLKKFESSDCIGGRLNQSYLERGLLRHAEQERLHGTPFTSEHEMTNMVKHSGRNLGSSLLIEKVTPIKLNPFLSPLGGASKNSGTQYRHEEVFSTKRQRLHQWVADKSPEIDELCSKGYDLVSVLLSRLLPMSNENNCCRDPKLRQAEIDTKSQFLTYPEPDTHFRELHWTPTRNFMERVHGPHLDDDSSACWFNRSGDRILPRWDVEGSNSPPTNCANKIHLQCGKGELDCEVYGGRTASLFTESDAAFGFSFEKYETLPSCHLKELDESHDPNESELRREPHTLLLDWDFDSVKDERDLAITPYNMELNMYPTSPTSWRNDHQQSLDNIFDASGCCLSSFHSKLPPNFTSLPHFHSASYRNDDIGRHVLEDKEYLITELNRFPLNLSCNPNCHCDFHNICKDSSIFLCPQNHDSFMSKIFSEKHYPGLEAILLSSQLDFDLGWKCLSVADSSAENNSSTCHALSFPQKEDISSYLLTSDEYESCLDSSSHRETLNLFAEDVLDIHDWSSISFQISVNKEKACPLLLDKSSWAGSVREVYHSDSESKYI